MRRPKLVLLLAGLAVLALAPGLARLELRTDGAALVPDDAPEVLADAALRERFGLRDLAVVVLEARTPAGVYEPRLLERLRALSRAMPALDGVRAVDVESLGVERSDRVRTGSLDFRPWLEPLPRTPDELARLRADLEEVDIYGGTLLAHDEPASAAAILVGVPPGADRRAFARELRALVADTAAAGDEALFRTHVVGAPLVESLLGDHLLADLARLVPLSVLVLALVFWLVFRNPVAVALPLVEVGAALVATFGLMGWLGVPVYLTVAVLPVILTAVGIADELHLFTAFLRRRRAFAHEPVPDSVVATRREMTRPIVATSVTTALGFCAFALSPLEAVRVFGAFMAFGVVFCMTWSLFVVPACLMLLPAGRWSTGAPFEALGARVGRLVARSLEHPWRPIGGAALLVVAASLGLGRVFIQDSWIQGFAPGSELRASSELVNERFGGTHLLQVEVAAREVRHRGVVARAAFDEDGVMLPEVLTEQPALLRGHRFAVDVLGKGRPVTARVVHAELVAGGTRLELEVAGRDRSFARWLPTRLEEVEYELDATGAVTRPEVLERLGALERFLAGRTSERVGRVVGPHEHLVTMNFMLHARRPETRALPADEAQVQSVLGHYVRVRGEERLRKVLDARNVRALVTVFLRDADFAAVSRLLDALDEFAARELAPHGLELTLGGDVARSQALIRGVVDTQVRSLAFALLGIVAVASFVLRSVGLGLLCALPAGLAVLADFALLGFAGIPLGVATSMFAGMTIGIGVDYALHLVLRVRGAGQRDRAAIARAVRETAPAVTIDALALGLAFGLLTLSGVPANARLGALMVLSLATCLAATLLLLPALLGVYSPSSRASSSQVVG